MIKQVLRITICVNEAVVYAKKDRIVGTTCVYLVMGVVAGDIARSETSCQQKLFLN